MEVAMALHHLTGQNHRNHQHNLLRYATPITSLIFAASNNVSVVTYDSSSSSSSISSSSSGTTELNLDRTEGEGHGDYPFPSKLTWLHIVLSALVLGVIILFIIVGNTLVVVAIAVDRNLNTVQNYFIASLAVSDLSLGALVMPLSLTKELIGYWCFGDTLCDIWLAVDVFLCTASILNLCLISLDRYWSVTRAVSYAKQRTARRAMAMIAIAWSLALIICLPPLAGWKRLQTSHSDKYPSCQLSSEVGYVAYSALGSFFIPLSLMIVVYVKIYMTALARARRNLKRSGHVINNKGRTDKSTSVSSSSPLANKTATLAAPTTSQHDVIKREYSSYEDDDDYYADDVSTAGAAKGGGSSRLAPVSEVPNSDSTTDFGGSDGALMTRVTNSNYHHERQLSSNDEHSRLLDGLTSSAEGDSYDGSGGTSPRQLRVGSASNHHHHTRLRGSLSHSLAAPVSPTTLTMTADNGAGSVSAGSYLTITSTHSVDFDAALKSLRAQQRPASATSEDETERADGGVEDNLKPLLSQRPSSPRYRSNSGGFAGTDSNGISRSRARNASLFRSFITRSKRHPPSSSEFDLKPLGQKHQELQTQAKVRGGSLTSQKSWSNCQRAAGAPGVKVKGGSTRGPMRTPSILLNSSRFQKFGSKIFRGSQRGDNGHRRTDDPERQRRKIAKQRERRATVVLGVVMVTFIGSWLPFFIIYPMSIFVGFEVPGTLFAVIFWAGYCNSAMNPIIYTIFNREFRQAFYKILCKRLHRS